MALRQITASLSEIGLDDVARVGGKGANLGHLLKGGFPVPPGFCVLSEAYESFLAQPDLEHRIRGILDPLDLSDLTAVEEAAARIRELFLSVPLPAPTEWQIAAAYRGLLEEAGADALVAVRSSVGTKDLSVTSFPGQMDTYHNLRGEDEVLRKVVECWASAFSFKAMVNRHSRGIAHFDVFVAPLVQAMVAADSAGVIFTANPLNGREDQLVINACHGLGEGVVSGELQCDHLVLDTRQRRRGRGGARPQGFQDRAGRGARAGKRQGAPRARGKGPSLHLAASGAPACGHGPGYRCILRLSPGYRVGFRGRRALHPAGEEDSNWEQPRAWRKRSHPPPPGPGRSHLRQAAPRSRARKALHPRHRLPRRRRGMGERVRHHR